MPREKKMRALKAVPEIQICTEGKTEELYIKGFLKEHGLEKLVRVNCPHVNAGCGRSQMALCEKAQECFKKSSSLRECYIVFDYDEAESSKAVYDNFCKAIYYGNSNDCTYSIFSIPNFELWLMLHLQFFKKSMDKDDCIRTFLSHINRMRKDFGLPAYTKDQHKVDSELYELIKEKQETANINAEKLIKYHEIDLDKIKEYNLDKLASIFKTINPSTNMHALIQNLKKEKST